LFPKYLVARRFMKDGSLPENWADWPTDPFELFGVTPAVTPRELRRIYTRLIREFKPERAPEQFRRIREAYETLQQYAAWNEVQDKDAGAEALSPPRSLPVAPNSQEQTAPEQPDIRPAFEAREDYWAWAIEGKLERAYRACLDLRERKPEHACYYSQLYWLLLAMPALDAERSPCDWLAQGLRNCSQYAGLLDLYQEELADEPKEALTPRFGELLEQVRGVLLTELVERRWQAIAMLGRWDVAGDDLDILDERVGRDDELAWLRLLLSLASKSFRWQIQNSESVFRACQARIKRLDHLALANAEIFDRAELLGQMSREVPMVLPFSNQEEARRAGALTRRFHETSALLDAISHFAAGRTEEAGQAIEPFLQLTCTQPGEGLRLLEQTASIAPGLFMELGRALEWLFWTTPRNEVLAHSEDAAGLLLARLMDEVLGNDTYPKARLRLANFCCAEALSPEQICELLEAPEYSPNYFGQKIADDLALHWTYRAYMLGWTKKA
jgi:hypothetical protein